MRLANYFKFAGAEQILNLFGAKTFANQSLHDCRVQGVRLGGFGWRAWRGAYHGNRLKFAQGAVGHQAENRIGGEDQGESECAGVGADGRD